jgi:hypothetical protein
MGLGRAKRTFSSWSSATLLTTAASHVSKRSQRCFKTKITAKIKPTSAIVSRERHSSALQ